VAVAFTPFGVTWLNEKSAIYDLVPVQVFFKEGAVLQMKKIIPVLIDKEKKEIFILEYLESFFIFSRKRSTQRRFILLASYHGVESYSFGHQPDVGLGFFTNIGNEVDVRNL